MRSRLAFVLSAHFGTTAATPTPPVSSTVGAATAIIGVGTDNDYGHPHPDVLADLAGTEMLRTDTSGTVSVAVE